MKPILEIKDLNIRIKTKKSNYSLVEDLSLYCNAKETFGIVGESGCGKSLTALSIMGLISSPLYVAGGAINFNGRDLLKLSKGQMRKIRGKELTMIFQEPMTSLDPVFTVENQIMEVLKIHKDLPHKDMTNLIKTVLEKVGIGRIDQVMRSYPHELSGGMLQRIMIAMAMICNPQLLIADEPTTALDVTIQAQILNLMNELKSFYDTSIIIITHDLGVVAETCQRVAVLYGGQVVEEADVVDIFHNPVHPYTKGLLKSVQSLNSKGKRLHSIKGVVPPMDEMPVGCKFSGRCEHKMKICDETPPELVYFEKNHKCRCHLINGGREIV